VRSETAQRADVPVTGAAAWLLGLVVGSGLDADRQTRRSGVTPR
jgi:hypothetical protein